METFPELVTAPPLNEMVPLRFAVNSTLWADRPPVTTIDCVSKLTEPVPPWKFEIVNLSVPPDEVSLALRLRPETPK